MRLTPPVTACLNCDRPITTTPGKRAKLYCDPSCKSNYRQKQQRLAKKAAAGLPLPADYVDTSESGMAMIHPDGTKEPLIVYKKASKKAFDGKKTKIIIDEFATGVDPFNKGKSKAKVTITDLNKPTGKKVVSDPPPTTNTTINTMPVRMKGEDAIDFAARKNAWKRKQK